jgi:hypothetical protein
MTDIWTFLSEFFHVYQYHIIPAILSGVMFLFLCFSKQRKNLISIILQVASIFSITLSAEYLLIFLIFDSLPEAIGLFEKTVLGIGIVITLLIVIRDCSNGTRLGDWITKILGTFSNYEENLIPIGPFSEQLKKLLALNDQIQKGNKEQISSAYFEFTHIGKSIVTFLKYNPTSACGESNLKYEEAQQLFNECDVCFKQIYLPENEFNEILKTNTSITVSNFIGFVEGLNFLT